MTLGLIHVWTISVCLSKSIGSASENEQCPLCPLFACHIGFGNDQVWQEVLAVVFDFDSMSTNDFMGRLSPAMHSVLIYLRACHQTWSSNGTESTNVIPTCLMLACAFNAAKSEENMLSVSMPAKHQTYHKERYYKIQLPAMLSALPEEHDPDIMQLSAPKNGHWHSINNCRHICYTV